MNKAKGFVGLFIFLCGVGMAFFEQTKNLSSFPIGFGAVVSVMGFSNGNNNKKKRQE